MQSSSPDFHHQKSLQIKQDDKFFSRLLSKESSAANPSFRVYYGGVSGAVPFTWESMPGTPKYTFSDNSLPPLTPPPSYYFSPNKKLPKDEDTIRSKLLHTLLFMIKLIKKAHTPSSPSSSSSSNSWSSSQSSISVPMTRSGFLRRRRYSTGSSFDGVIMVDDEVSVGSKTSRLCFGIGRERDHGGFRGHNSVGMMKRALLSMVGRGSGYGIA